MVNNVKKIADQILNIENIDIKAINGNNCFFDMNNEVIKQYKLFFPSNNISSLEKKIIYKKDENIKPFDGFVRETGWGLDGLNKVCILSSDIITPRLISVLAHEKTHAYQLLNKNDTNEVFPSFIDIIMSYDFENEYNNLFMANLKNKLDNAKFAAKKYIWFSKRKKEDEMEQLCNYIIDFNATLNLLMLYYKDESKIKETLSNNLFGNLNVKDACHNLGIYEDDNNIDNKVKLIKRSF